MLKLGIMTLAEVEDHLERSCDFVWEREARQGVEAYLEECEMDGVDIDAAHDGETEDG